MRSGFTGALLYYLLVTVTGTLTSAEGKAAVVLLYVLHGLISDLTGVLAPAFVTSTLSCHRNTNLCVLSSCTMHTSICSMSSPDGDAIMLM